MSEAVDGMKAERVAHGYKVLEDEGLYKRLRDLDIHFEVSLTSSYYTGACPDLTAHPAKR